MKHLACLSSLAAALYLGLPATGFSNDHHDHHDNHGSSHDNHGGDHGNWHGGHGNWHGGFYSGSHFHHSYRPYYPYFSAYPYYAAPYYGASYYDAYDDSPSFGVSISTAPTASYRGARVDDRADALTIDVQRALRRDGYYHGGIDGDLGAGTRAAIRQYQYDHRLEVTGRVDRALLRSLELE